MREQFVARFGEADAQAIERAAERHAQDPLSFLGLREGKGSDEFRWAVLVCISLQCHTKHREDHGIASPDINEWLLDPARHEWFKAHDGQIDILALMAGIFNPYCGKEPL